jgi:threonine dehydrogenase-like Zn-dependent dehydrogenase
MKAVVKRSSLPRDIEIKSVQLRDPKPDEVVVKIQAVGICGSDLHMYEGHPGYEWITYPLVLGHEMTGAVVTVGSEVSDSFLEKRVVINPYIPCGKCSYCQNGEENRCDHGEFYQAKRPPQSLRYGFRQDGGMAEYITVPARNVIPISDEVSEEVAAVSEAIAVGLTAVEKVREIDNKSFVIFGPGPIGLSIASLLVGLKAGKVVVVGIQGDEDRLKLAREIGVHHTVITNQQIVEQIVEIENGFDGVFDCSGHSSVPPLAIKILKKGGELVLVGISTNEFSLPMDQIVRGEIQIKGSYGITSNTYHRVIQYASKPQFPFGKLISHRFPLEQITSAFENAKNKAAGKTVVYFN